MSYVSFRFVIYVFVTTAVYFLYPALFHRHKEGQWRVLLVASLVFYGLCGGKYLFLLLLTGASVYGGALWLQQCQEATRKALSPADGRAMSREDKKRIKSIGQRRKRRILAAVLLLNFGILAFYKYVPDLVNRWLSGEFISLTIPIGISFYTFQATGYLIDVYNGNAKAERNPGKVLLFLSFFPQIVQGPISFWDPVAGEMFAEHRADWTRTKRGAELILWGYLRKMVLADRIVNEIYLVTDSYQEYSGTMIVLAVLLYAVQLYADFAGGIDISRGIAEILGIHLPDNFRQPYLSVSLNDYWRRWHITLGAWMKRYIFYPLALTPLFAGTGKRWKKTRFGKTAFGQHTAKVLPAALSCIVVFLVVGIWHGAGARYLAFGLWNGGLIFLSMILEPLFPLWRRALHISEKARWYHAFRILRTFVLVLAGYIFDVAQNLRSAGGMVVRIFTRQQWNPVLLYREIVTAYGGISTWNLAIVLMVTFLMIAVGRYHEKHDPHLGGDGVGLRARIDEGCWIKEWTLVLLCSAAILLLGIYGPGYSAVKFVYAGF